jgi:hypothetical protein
MITETIEFNLNIKGEIYEGYEQIMCPEKYPYWAIEYTVNGGSKNTIQSDLSREDVLEKMVKEVFDELGE